MVFFIFKCWYNVINYTKVPEIIITKLSDIINIITKLKSHKLYGDKNLDLLDFCKVIEMIKNK